MSKVHEFESFAAIRRKVVVQTIELGIDVKTRKARIAAR